MPKLKLTEVAAVATALASLPTAPAVAGPWIAPWALGHVIGAAARLATRPIIAASAASAAGQPRPAAPLAYGAPAPLQYAAPSYYGPPAYGLPPAYYTPRVGYYGAPPVSVYRNPASYVPAMPLPSARYSVTGMRYSGPYGRPVFNRSRGFAYRRW